MKNVSKICLGLITVFSLAACGKGSKVTRDKFFEATENIKEDNFKKAKLIYKSVRKKGYGSDLETEKEAYSGIYVKDEFGEWKSGSDKNDSKADSLFKDIVKNYNLNEFSESNNRFEDNDDDAEEKYYIKPFSYEKRIEGNEDYSDIVYESSNETRIYSAKSSSKNKYKYTQNLRFEWNDYGYITRIEDKDETKRETSDKTYIDNVTVTLKITYK